MYILPQLITKKVYINFTELKHVSKIISKENLGKFLISVEVYKHIRLFFPF